MKRFFFILSFTIFSIEVRAECTQPPSCASLGYTQIDADCPHGSLKCPWNTGAVHCTCSYAFKYTCTGLHEKIISPKCGNKYSGCGCDSGYTWKNGSCIENCKIGWIYYSDGSCAAPQNHDAEKNALGVIVYTDGRNGQVIAINDIGEYSWSTEVVDIPGLTNYTSQSSAMNNVKYDFTSTNSTYQITKQGDNSLYPAAWAVRDYAPPKALETRGKWSIPSAGIFNQIRLNIYVIQQTIEKLGGTRIQSCCTWSSSEYSSHHAWYSNLNVSSGLDYGDKGFSRYVRPVFSF